MTDLVGVVRDLIHEVTRLRAENEKLVRRPGASFESSIRRSRTSLRG